MSDFDNVRAALKTASKNYTDLEARIRVLVQHGGDIEPTPQILSERIDAVAGLVEALGLMLAEVITYQIEISEAVAQGLEDR